MLRDTCQMRKRYFVSDLLCLRFFRLPPEEKESNEKIIIDARTKKFHKILFAFFLFFLFLCEKMHHACVFYRFWWFKLVGWQGSGFKRINSIHFCRNQDEKQKNEKKPESRHVHDRDENNKEKRVSQWKSLTVTSIFTIRHGENVLFLANISVNQSQPDLLT